MEYDKEIVWWLKFIVVVCIFIALVCIFSIHQVLALDVSNITLEQQNNICTDLNLSFMDCFGFWNIVGNHNVSKECNYSNYTLNTNIVNMSNCTEVEPLTKIDDYAIRGFEPVFSDGIITNWAKKKNESCEAYDCTKQCATAVNDYKDRNKNISEDSEDNDSFFYVIMGMIVLLIIGYFLYQKMRKNKGGGSTLYSSPITPIQPMMPTPDVKLQDPVQLPHKSGENLIETPEEGDIDEF